MKYWPCVYQKTLLSLSGFLEFKREPRFQLLTTMLTECNSHLIWQLPFLRKIHLLLFSFYKSSSLSEWPFNRAFYHQCLSLATAKCLSPKHSSSHRCKQSGQLIFCIDLLTRDSSQITFLCPESPKGVLCNAGCFGANSPSDHASYWDYSMTSTYQKKYDFVTWNVTLPFFKWLVHCWKNVFEFKIKLQP